MSRKSLIKNHNVLVSHPSKEYKNEKCSPTRSLKKYYFNKNVKSNHKRTENKSVNCSKSNNSRNFSNLFSDNRSIGLTNNKRNSATY